MIGRTRFAFHDLAPGEESFRDAVLKGLGRNPKSIPCKFLYDARGSALFEEICRLPEYYPTRTEIAILEQNAVAIAARIGPHSRLIEFGAGAITKARILLRALDRPAAYVPVDISREHLPTIPVRFRYRLCRVQAASGWAFFRARRSAISSPTQRWISSPIMRKSSGLAAKC